MKEKMKQIWIGFAIWIVFVAAISYAIGITNARRVGRENYLKSALIEPNQSWLGRHGNSMDSWQAYNIAVLVEQVKKQAKEKPAK